MAKKVVRRRASDNRYLHKDFHGAMSGGIEYLDKRYGEEAADFTMEIDEKAGKFKIVMHHCPSKGRLLKYKHMQSYRDYCKHCDVLYRNRVLEPLGYKYSIDLSECDKARCVILVTGKSQKRSQK